MKRNLVVSYYKNEVLDESIHDKYLFKSVFMAGGGGSGKSFISSLMFDGTGVKFVNTDILFERFLGEKDLPFKIDPSNKEIYIKQSAERQRSKNLTKGRFNNWVNGMLPLVIDGTGREFAKIKSQRDILSYIGYDTTMVFVNTSLEVAIERNKGRDREVPEEELRAAWKDAQENIGKFQSLFGQSNLIILDNSKVLDKPEVEKLKLEMFRKAMKFLNSTLENKIGNQILKILKQSGGLYLTDLADVDTKILQQFRV